MGSKRRKDKEGKSDGREVRPKPAPSRERTWAVAAVLAILALIVFFPSFKIPFLLDDYQIYLNQWPIPSWPSMATDVLNHFQQNRILTHVSWYAQMVMAMPEPPSPFAFHVVNLILHWVNAMLVYVLARAFGARNAASALTAAIFAAHPANMEAVSYIYGRSDLQVTALILGALILLKDAPRKWIAAAVCLAAAAFTKESAVVSPAMYVMIAYVLRPPEYRPHPSALVLTGLATAVALAGFVLFKTDHADNFGYGFEDSFRYLMLQPVCLFVGLIRLVIPAGFTIVYQFDLPASILDLRVICSIGFWASAIALAVLKWNRGNRNYIFAIGWYLAAMAPTNSVVPRIDQISDRHMYLALIGPMWAMSTALESAWTSHGDRIRRLSWALVVIFGALTFIQNTRWQSAIYIWREAAERFPNWALAHRELASEYGRAGMPEKEIDILEYATRRWLDDWTSWNNLGVAYASTGRHDYAQRAFRHAIDGVPKRHRALLKHNLAFSLQNTGQIQAAISEYREALADDPGRSASKQNLAILLWQSGDAQSGEKLIAEILAENPRDEMARRALGVIRAARPPQK